ncbi:site-specific DNA-methyltransferase [Staphylococcus epidermidis]|nr:site-specific DNA-methyltransferase [Staphylococcus epidermidis]MCG1726779.1 site-specific DNA-methyltransferase [Staphylococcus epidermidis]
MKLTIKEAAKYITEYLSKTHKINKIIKPSNVSYLVQYGRINKYKESNRIYVDVEELKEYYNQSIVKKNNILLEKLGENYNPKLTFSYLSESQTTKHVHKIHPYKGKFIPQLVDYFINEEVDQFKNKVFFHKNDTILDPFMGSGTTLVEANEHDINSIGIDISEFNCKIGKAKTTKYNLKELKKESENLINNISNYINLEQLYFENSLKQLVNQYNKEYFPNPAYKKKVHDKTINEKSYSENVMKKFYKSYNKLIENYNIENPYKKDCESGYLDIWLLPSVKKEVYRIKKCIDQIRNKDIKNLFQVILTRTVRSSRATKHSDLATLKEAQTEPYYCVKHFKICTPIFSCIDKFKLYLRDTINRLESYEIVRTDKQVTILHGDSTEIDVLDELKKENENLFQHIKDKKIDGIFTSPPYLGVIDYHEQHAYAYELLDIKRKDEDEIGKLSNGKSKKAKIEYIDLISKVFINCKKFIKKGGDIFIVANDDLNLYPKIFEKANLKLIQKFERPVLNRTERNKKLYTETIFHCKEK